MNWGKNRKEEVKLQLCCVVLCCVVLCCVVLSGDTLKTQTLSLHSSCGEGDQMNISRRNTLRLVDSVSISFFLYVPEALSNRDVQGDRIWITKYAIDKNPVRGKIE